MRYSPVRIGSAEWRAQLAFEQIAHRVYGSDIEDDDPASMIPTGHVDEIHDHVMSRVIALRAIRRDMRGLSLRLQHARILEDRHALAIQMNHTTRWGHEGISAGIPGRLDRRSISAQPLDEHSVI